MAVLLIAAGLILIFLAVQFNLLGVDAETFETLPMQWLLIALGVLVFVWLWRRRSKRR